MRVVLALALLLAAAPAPAITRERPGSRAPEPPPVVEEGARVRITLLERPHERLVGTLVAIRPEAFEVRRDSLTRTIGRVDIGQLELSRGIKSGAGKGAKYGAIFGGLVLGGFGVLVGAIGNAESSEENVSPALAGVAFGLAGAAVGGGLGALVMSGTHYERWDEVPLE